ncbi:Uncharacterized protein SCF082_LOCUS28225 [Durusdinium trenchii]|uniref:Uncharacterized protein n=1 Tax=Durusdinium trenchii TaxID=1381693 RepID=A0ABP0MMT8_9DINO
MLKGSTFVSAKKHFQKVKKEEDELAPFPWPCKSVKRVRSSTHGHTDWSHLLYRNLPLEVEKKRANHGSQSSLAWKDDYLQHDDLKNLPRSRDVFHKIEVDPELTMELPKPGLQGCKNNHRGGETMLDVSGPYLTYVVYKSYKRPSMQASCVSQIQTAAAVETDMGKSKAISKGVSEWVHPTFGLFDRDDVDLSRTAAFVLHGDEGRALKKGAMLVTSLQSALGRGYDQKRVNHAGTSRDLKVNFAGHSFTTRWIVHTIPKSAYDGNPELFNSAMEHTAKSCRKLLEQGYVDVARGHETFRVVILGVKGDAPYLSKVGRFYRAYNTTAKRGEERGAPKGVCPYCLAGTRMYPAEELSTADPTWLSTVAVKLLWTRCPAVIKHLLHDTEDPADFFKSDVWHICHLGIGKSWICSVLQLMMPFMPCPNLEAKFDFMTTEYLAWCCSKKEQAHISRISSYLISYNDATGAMGHWHKGALTSNFMLWLVDFLGTLPRDPDGYSMKCRAVTYRMNAMFSVLYRSVAFLTEEQAAFVATQGLAFLDCYATMAAAMFNAGRQHLYPLYPKLHMFHHIMITVQRQGSTAKVAVNPTMWGCQMDEDTVGRASRLSRRVNIRLVAQRSLERYLVAAFTAFTKAGLLG